MVSTKHAITRFLLFKISFLPPRPEKYLRGILSQCCCCLLRLIFCHRACYNTFCYYLKKSFLPPMTEEYLRGKLCALLPRLGLVLRCPLVRRFSSERSSVLKERRIVSPSKGSRQIFKQRCGSELL